jgi:hypothetical protein
MPSSEELIRFQKMVEAQGGVRQLQKVITAAQKSAGINSVDGQLSDADNNSRIASFSETLAERKPYTGVEKREVAVVEQKNDEVVLSIPHLEAKFGARGTYQDPKSTEVRSSDIANLKSRPAGSNDGSELKLHHETDDSTFSGFMSPTKNDQSRPRSYR